MTDPMMADKVYLRELTPASIKQIALEEQPDAVLPTMGGQTGLNLAQDLKADGRDIIALSAGEPDFGTPEHIRAAGVAAIADGHTRYTSVDGIAELKSAICAKFRRDNTLEYGPENISVSSGGKQVLYNALMATLNPGDEVIIPTPYWVSYPDIVRLGGGTPVAVPTTLQTGFRLTPEALEAAITPQTKWLIFNSPSNPTGAGYDRDALQALTEVLLRHPHVWILSDDIYEHITFDGFTFVTPAQVERICAGCAGPALPLILDECSHWPHLEQGERSIAAIAGFLAELS